MKNTIRLVLTLFLLAMAATAPAQYGYITNNGTITITGYTGPGGSVTIPTNINGLTVTSIGTNAFQDNFGLAFLTIPGSITNIGDNAFNTCVELSMVIISNGVLSIGNYAFSGCSSLETVGLTPGGFMLPNSVTSIGDGAFEGTRLSSAALPASVTNLGGNPFAGCSSVTSIGVATNNPAYTNIAGILFNKNITMLIGYPAGKAGSSYSISNTVTSIGNNAFDECSSLTSLIIPTNVVSIGDEAFNACVGLTNVIIPYSVTNIGMAPFQSCGGIAAISVATNNPAYISVAGVLFNLSQTTLIEYPTGAAAGPYTIPNSVTNVANNAFTFCDNLTDVTISSNAISIGNYAFSSCSSLTGVTMFTGITSIGDWAFYNCQYLTNLTIPNGIIRIGDFAFSLDSSLTSLVIPDSVTSIGVASFAQCYGLHSVVIPGSITNFGGSAFYFCRTLTIVTLGDGLTSIGTFGFNFCSSLKSVTIPASVTNIGSDAFSTEQDLSGLYFEGNAPSVGEFFTGSNTTNYYLPGTTGWTSPFNGVPAALWTPSILTTDGFFGIQSNQFGFNVSWASNESVTVQASPSPANPVWTALTNVSLTNGLFYFSDAGWTNYPGRYYRITYP